MNLPQNEMEKFKNILKEWLLLDSEINERSKYIRELKKKRDKEIEPLLINYMNKNKITNLNTNEGTLKYVEKVTKQCLNKQNIKSNLSSVINDELLLERALDKIFNNRKETTNYKLTRVK
tara:strand:+ start:1184 stop:1543 length:360 start_codon:yes stop_codon:yes gene_type:complete